MRRVSLFFVAALVTLVAAWGSAYAQLAPMGGMGATGGPMDMNTMLQGTPIGQALAATPSPKAKKKSPGECIKDAKKYLRDMDPRVRVEALNLLQFIPGKHKAEAEAILLRSLSDPDLRVKIKALDILGQYQDRDAVEPAAQLLFLRETPPAVKLHAVAALGRIGDPRGALPVMGYLREAKGQRQQGTAVFALGEMGNPQAIDLLTKIAGDNKDQVVRHLAQEALAKISGELPSVHSQEVAAERAKHMRPTFEKLTEMRKIDAKLQEMDW